MNELLFVSLPCSKSESWRFLALQKTGAGPNRHFRSTLDNRVGVGQFGSRAATSAVNVDAQTKRTSQGQANVFMMTIINR